jgi:hypothetical protein
MLINPFLFSSTGTRLWQECNGHELTFKEKTDIKFDKKLCCQTMNFCQSVTKSQFPCITGFQNTTKLSNGHNRYDGFEQMVKVGISFYVDKSICCFQAQELSM